MLNTTTFPGAPDGMARYLPQHELQQTEAWTIFDALVDIPGLIRRRGPLELYGGVEATDVDANFIGIIRTQDPAGVEQVVKLDYLTSAAGLMRGVVNSTMEYDWPYTPANDPQEVFDAKDALNGGVIIGTAPTYDKPSQQAVALWRGAGKDTTAATTLAISVALGDPQVTLTASGGTAFCAGHFLFNVANELIGVVKSKSGDVLTLEHPALAIESVTVYGTPFRGINPRVSKGRITTSTTSAVVNGGNTKFLSQGLDSGTWDLFTPDFAWIGRVDSVAADAQLTLEANAAVALLSADYIAIKTSGSYSLTRAAVGYLNASFAGHQFYADSNKLRFSDLTDPEAVDLTTNGDELEFSSDPIRAILPGQTALVTLTEKEAYTLVGAVGTTPDRWRGERIHDDGTLCGMGGVTYKGGVIWPGKRGVWYWDGADPINIVGKLDDDYREFVVGAERAWGAVIKDHYFLFIEGGTTEVFFKVKDQIQTDFQQLTIVVNLKNGAVTLLTNVGIRGAVPIPDSLGLGSVMYGVTLDGDSSSTALGDDLFKDDATDDAACLNDIAGPDFYLESQKYDMGDGQRLKLIKMLLLWYRSVGGQLRIDAVRGLEDDGVLVTAQFPDTDDYVDRRAKFMARSQYLAFRLYQSTTKFDGSDADVTRVTLGPWAIGYKWKKPGRV